VLDDDLSQLDYIDGAKLTDEKKEQMLYIVGTGRRRASSVFKERLSVRYAETKRPSKPVIKDRIVNQVIV